MLSRADASDFVDEELIELGKPNTVGEFQKIQW